MKRALPDTVSYGQIKLVAALRHVGGTWFGGGEGTPSSQPPAPQHAAQSQADPSAPQVKVQLVFSSPPRPRPLGPFNSPAWATDIISQTCHPQALASTVCVHEGLQIAEDCLHIRLRMSAVRHTVDNAASTMPAASVGGCT